MPVRNIDLSSWQNILVTLLVLAMVTLIGVGVRVVMMMTIQQRRERMNRQINERLRALIAAYKTLGGSFTGDLAVDPTHLRDLHARAHQADSGGEAPLDLSLEAVAGSERRRRIRDAVEAALSDIILLGTEEQVRLAQRAANELVAGRPVHTHDLVVSLRNFVRLALDLDPIPADVVIPMQGPARPSGTAARGKGEGREGSRSGGGGMDSGGGGGAALGASALGRQGLADDASAHSS
ncbi:hypothetical protein [Sphingomonas koreensis]